MQLSEITELKETIQPQIQNGDYVTLSKMLNCTQDTARKKFYRDNEEAVTAMQIICESRTKMIESFLNPKA